MRIGLYNRWLSILGGGERYMLELGLVLARLGHQVELLSQRLVDPALVRTRLGLEIGALGMRKLADEPGAAVVTEASAEYDLFIAVSHGDLFPSLARRSWMVVFFPEAEIAAGPEDKAAPYIWRGGYAEELDGAGRRFRWLAPEGAIWLPPGDAQEVTITCERPNAGRVEWVFEDGAGKSIDLHPGKPVQMRLTLPRRQLASGMLLSWRAAPLLVDDPRPLGLRLLGVALGRRRFLLSRPRELLPSDRPEPALALRSYSRLLAISDYTASWIIRRWGRRAEILPPPVPQYQPGAKHPLILSVGRFFRGLHAKRHDILIEAFRLLASSSAGWELHLAGGLDEANQDHQGYVEELRRAASGLPVHFHINVAGDRLAELYSAASFYWHAAGYGSDPEQVPEAQEHFGITTVEAMSAGCVPLVYATGGPAEVVRDGIDGYHWREPEDLAGKTRALIAGPELRERLGCAARERAASYSPEAFAGRVDQLLREEMKDHQ
ncbi:MAG: hypothetical protein KatS3mg057_1416 [Herpetosiphonaceae bacterium]|nr:MAG: hypothetical protein KatS3mg057_1416 [Herpetosiphonaceae bacterium]